MISDFKNEAKEKLNGKWGKVVCITLAYSLIILIFSFIENAIEDNSGAASIFSLIVAIIEVPLSYGLIAVYYKAFKAEKVEAFDFWTMGFKNFERSWGVEWRVFLKTLIPSILSFIAIVALAISISAFSDDFFDDYFNNYDSYNDNYFDDFSDNYFNNDDSYSNDYFDDDYNDYYDDDDYNDSNNDYQTPLKYNSTKININKLKLEQLSKKSTSASSKNNSASIFIAIISSIIIIVCMIWLIPIFYSYKLAKIIAIDHEEMSTKEAVDMSKKLMNGNRLNLFFLELSFIGWWILAALSLGIGLLWLMPYMNFSYFSFYKCLVEKENSKVETIENQNNI